MGRHAQSRPLRRLERSHGYTTRQGLFSDEVLEILEMDGGWLSCSKGMFRVRKRELDDLDGGKTEVVASVAFEERCMESAQCSGPRLAECDGRL